MSTPGLPPKPPAPKLPPPEPPPAEVYLRLDLSRGSPYSRSEYARKLVWRIVQATLWRIVRPRQRTALLRLFGADVHPTTNIRGSVRIHHPWLLRTGEYSSLGDHVHIYNLGPVVIGPHTTISQHAYLCAGSHDWRDPAMPLLRSSITIGAGCWLCAHVFVGPDVRIGNNCVIGARAAVVSNIPDKSIAGGNPARVLKERPPGSHA